jgi:hypothetical protein
MGRASGDAMSGIDDDDDDVDHGSSLPMVRPAAARPGNGMPPSPLRPTTYRAHSTGTFISRKNESVGRTVTPPSLSRK